MTTNTQPATASDAGDELPAGFSTQRYVLVSCCSCEEIYSGDYVLHFPDKATAQTEITDAGWRVDENGVTCIECVTRATCAEFGHDYQEPWRPCPCAGRVQAHTQPMELRSYERCGKSQARPRPNRAR